MVSYFHSKIDYFYKFNKSNEITVKVSMKSVY